MVDATFFRILILKHIAMFYLFKSERTVQDRILFHIVYMNKKH